MSGLLYLVFINELLVQLQNSNIRTGIDNLTCCAPTLADDIACIATSPCSLQRMLDICTVYSNRWRFQFNANKSCVVQFSKTVSKPDFQWFINSELIPISDHYTHLGIQLNGNMKSLNRTTNMCQKGRNTYFTIYNIRSECINPLALIRLYKTVVIPTSLYGCELWTNLKNQDFIILNRLQHFIVKHAQKLPNRTRSDMCESMVGLHPITCEIEKRKLYFLGKLCIMDSNFLPKKIFLFRLFTCIFDSVGRFGFIPDIFYILQKYNLSEFMLDYLLYGNFPTKFQWKHIVVNAIHSTETESWNIRTTTNIDFARFIQIHSSVNKACVWTLPSNCAELRTAFFIAKLIATVPDNTIKTCQLCNQTFKEIFVHVCCICSHTFEIRDIWWDMIIENFTLDLYTELSGLDDETLYCILLGKFPNTPLDNEDIENFRKLCFLHVVKCSAVYNRQLRAV